MHDDQEELLKKLAVQEAMLSLEQAVAYDRFCNRLRDQGLYDVEAAIFAANTFRTARPYHLTPTLYEVESAAKGRANERIRWAEREEAERAWEQQKAQERQQAEEQREREAQAAAQREEARAKEHQQAQERQQAQEQREREARSAAARAEPVPGSVEHFDAALEQRQAEREALYLSQRERRNNADMDRLTALGPQRPNYRLLKEQPLAANESTASQAASTVPDVSAATKGTTLSAEQAQLGSAAQ